MHTLKWDQCDKTQEVDNHSLKLLHRITNITDSPAVILCCHQMECGNSHQQCIKYNQQYYKFKNYLCRLGHENYSLN